MIWISVSILITYLLCLIPLSDKKPSFDVYEVCTELKHALSTSEISIESSLNQNNYSPKQKRIHINGDFLNSLHLTAVVLHEFGHYLTIKREHSLLDKIAKAMFFIAFILMLYFVYSIVNTFFYNIINISIIHYISIVFSSFASIYYTFTTYLELRANITALKLNKKMNILKSEHKYISLSILKSFMAHLFNLLFFISLIFVALQFLLR